MVLDRACRRILDSDRVWWLYPLDLLFCALQESTGGTVHPRDFQPPPRLSSITQHYCHTFSSFFEPWERCGPNASLTRWIRSAPAHGNP